MIRLLLRDCPGCGLELDFIADLRFVNYRTREGSYIGEDGRELAECPRCEQELDA